MSSPIAGCIPTLTTTSLSVSPARITCPLSLNSPRTMSMLESFRKSASENHSEDSEEQLDFWNLRESDSRLTTLDNVNVVKTSFTPPFVGVSTGTTSQAELNGQPDVNTEYSSCLNTGGSDNSNNTDNGIEIIVEEDDHNKGEKRGCDEMENGLANGVSQNSQNGMPALRPIGEESVTKKQKRFVSFPTLNPIKILGYQSKKSDASETSEIVKFRLPVPTCSICKVERMTKDDKAYRSVYLQLETSLCTILYSLILSLELQLCYLIAWCLVFRQKKQKWLYKNRK